MPKIAVHFDKNAPTPYPEKWSHYLSEAGATVKAVNLRLPDAVAQVEDCDGVMWHWEFMPHERQVGYRILHTIEYYLQKPVFPNHLTAWHYDDKLTQYYLFQALEIPTPQSWVFWDHEEARKWVQETTFPKIMKLATGASSMAVLTVTTAAEANAMIDLMFGPGCYPDQFGLDKVYTSGIPKNSAQLRSFLRRWKDMLRWALKDRLPDVPHRFWWEPHKGYVYFQEFLPNNDYDTRITVIGDRAFGFRRYNRPGDFRASGSGLIEYDPTKIDPQFVQLAHESSKKLGSQTMAFDFLYDANREPVVTEISYTYLDWAVQKCEGYWDESLEWNAHRMWPEEAQVIDFLSSLKTNSVAGETSHRSENHEAVML